MEGESFLKWLFLLFERQEGLNADYIVIIFCLRTFREEGLETSKPREDPRNAHGWLRMHSESFLDIGVLLAHFIGLRLLFYYTF